MYLKRLILLSLCALGMLGISSASGQELLYNGGLEDYDYGLNATGIDVTWPVTVSTASGDWNNMIGDWARAAAGDWDSSPLGTGNASSLCWNMRKGYGHVQILPLDEVAQGDQLQLDWSYYVESSFATEVTYQVKIFGVNVGSGGEATTTIAASDLSFGGESWNSAVLFTSEETISAGTGDGAWHDATTAMHTVADSWDYVGVWFNRTAGLYNNATQQMDDFSLQIVSTPNDPPVADADDDQTVTDSDDNDSEVVTLDASGSSDSDGTIVSYVWTEGATQIATGANPNVTLSVGVHTIVLTVTDDDNDTDTDTVVVTVNAYVPPQELLYNGGLEDYDYGLNATGIDVTWPVTVSTASGDWNNMIGDWARAAAGDWDSSPLGTGNASSLCWGMRKGYGHVQILPLNDVLIGDQLQLDWSYYVESSFATEVTYQVKIFGVNVASGGEAATTIAATDLSFGGESWNSAVLFTSEEIISAGTGDGAWHDSTTAMHTVTDSWDYVGVWFNRTAGLYNNATQQMDDFSLKIVSGGGNIPPSADANDDQTVTDNDDNGSEVVTLDGTGSSDSDGTIVSYVWTEGATQIATGANPSVTLSVGVHTIVLTVTDDDNDTDTDTVIVTVYPYTTAGNYYVDFDGGSDAQLGTSPATAWQHCPGDANATGTAASTALSAGDTVIFKGGVIYRGQITCTYSGSSGSPITYDGNTGGTFGTGAAILDGSETLSGWTQCQSATEAGGNPNWANIWYAYAPANTTANTANLYQFDTNSQTDNLCLLAQGPNPSDQLFMDYYNEFYSVSLANMSRSSITDSVNFTQSDPTYWDGAYVMIWRVPNRIQAEPITGFNPATDTITFPTITNDPQGNPSGHYAIYNHISMIDQAGEYFFNETPEGDGTHKVWLWPHTGNPNSDPVSVSIAADRHSAFVLTNNLSYVTFDGLKMHKYAGGGVYGSRYGGAGINCNATSGLSNLIIRYCEFIGMRHDYTDYNGYGAISLNGSDHLIEENYFYELPLTNAMQLNLSDTIIQNNYVERPGRLGLWQTFTDCIIQDNIFIEVLGSHANAISVFPGSLNVEVRRNIVLDSPVPLAIGGATNTTASYNFLHCHDSYAYAGYDENSNTKVHNNTLIREDNDKPSWTSQSADEFKNNIMYTFGNQGSLTPDANGNLIINHSMDSTVFADVANFDYSLVTGSPALDAGLDLGYSSDIEGVSVPQNGTPDIGAYEYVP